jgi:hypothetical protein
MDEEAMKWVYIHVSLASFFLIIVPPLFHIHPQLSPEFSNCLNKQHNINPGSLKEGFQV